MSWVDRLFNVGRRDRVRREAEEELRFHYESRIRDGVAAGMQPRESRHDAERRIGGRLQSEERSTDADLVVWLDTTLRDIRLAFRNLAKNRRFAVVASLSLALGIGANTAIFSAVRSVLLRPLPYKDPERLCNLWMDNRRLGLHEDLSAYGNFIDWKKNRVFTDMAGYVPTDSVLSGLIGTVGGLALSRALSGFLYGVKPTDPLTYVAVVALLAAVAAAASAIPARRVTGVDPMHALRYE